MLGAGTSSEAEVELFQASASRLPYICQPEHLRPSSRRSSPSTTTGGIFVGDCGKRHHNPPVLWSQQRRVIDLIRRRRLHGDNIHRSIAAISGGLLLRFTDSVSTTTSKQWNMKTIWSRGEQELVWRKPWTPLPNSWKGGGGRAIRGICALLIMSA